MPIRIGSRNLIDDGALVNFCCALQDGSRLDKIAWVKTQKEESSYNTSSYKCMKKKITVVF